MAPSPGFEPSLAVPKTAVLASTPRGNVRRFRRIARYNACHLQPHEQQTGFEPATFCLASRRSNQLSYYCMFLASTTAPGVDGFEPSRNAQLFVPGSFNRSIPVHRFARSRTPCRSRTDVTSVKNSRPRPLDEWDVRNSSEYRATQEILVFCR